MDTNKDKISLKWLMSCCWWFFVICSKLCYGPRFVAYFNCKSL